ncbi:MAG TPA: ATP-NAD kinase family protein [Candidatus Deferrimicrobium sp.]|nr:ATP-NAD kinase family protein [Candidatus Deferrimicrobium sp.]
MLGSKPVSSMRAREMLRILTPLKNKLKIFTFSAEMGENELIDEGFEPIVIGTILSGKTTSQDTINAARRLIEQNVQFIVFVGGDGTAQDILIAIGQEVPVLGCPSGVKIHSSCFAFNPEACARIIMRFLWEELPIREAEVIDVNEEAFRNNQLDVELKGYLIVPYEPYLLQGGKMVSPLTIDEHDNQIMIAKYVVENMEDDIYYILGPGTTIRGIAEVIGFEKTLLGVDICCNKTLIAKDVNEKQILQTISNNKAKIVVSPIGNQGIILGRGNLQISPEVIWKVGRENIIVIATRYKIANLPRGFLRVDTRDINLDNTLKNSYIRVIVDYNEIRIIKIK